MSGAPGTARYPEEQAPHRCMGCLWPGQGSVGSGVILSWQTWQAIFSQGLVLHTAGHSGDCIAVAAQTDSRCNQQQ